MGCDMKGGSGDKFFTIDHLLMVSHAYIPNFRALALLLLVEKQKPQRSAAAPARTPETMANGHLVFN